jgi:hypothetical protein
MDEIKTRRDQLEEQAADFHKRNPEVWTLFCRFTFEAIKRGFRSYSGQAIFERIRWETDTADDEGRSTFKINNNHMPFYSRWFMMIYPEYDGFFRVRRLTSDDSPAINLPELTPDDFPYTDWRNDYR